MQRVMAAKLSRLTHKIAIQLHLVAESCTASIFRLKCLDLEQSYLYLWCDADADEDWVIFNNIYPWFLVVI